jgi:hypothetical protein
MKTPRELLLERHRAANAKLDRIRTNVLSSSLSNEPRTELLTGQVETGLLIRATLNVWRELIWPCRFVWTGMAALWMVIFAINLSLADGRTVSQSARSSPTPAMLQAMEERRRLLAELIPPSVAPPAATPPQSSRPRSERRAKICIT